MVSALCRRTHLHEGDAERVAAAPQQRLAFGERLVVERDAIDLQQMEKVRAASVSLLMRVSDLWLPPFSTACLQTVEGTRGTYLLLNLCHEF